MDKINSNSFLEENKLLHLLGALLRIAGIYLIGMALMVLFFRFVLGLDVRDLDALLAQQDTQDEKQNILILVQTIAPLFQFILLPLLYIFFYQKSLKKEIRLRTWKPAVFLMLGIFLFFTFLPVLQYLIKLNQSWDLPDAWADLEKQMYDLEEKARQITMLLIQYDSRMEFLIVLFVVAVLPAIGEELFFRGLLQNEIKIVTGSPHFAIWLTAIIFSFLHFQFYGFLPRLALGVLFGYIYFWSGNILIPIALHFLNNAATLILMHTFKDQYEKMEQQPIESIPVFGLMLAIILTSGIVFYTHKFYKERISLNGSEES